jgi:hypothetical protein
MLIKRSAAAVTSWPVQDLTTARCPGPIFNSNGQATRRDQGQAGSEISLDLGDLIWFVFMPNESSPHWPTRHDRNGQHAGHQQALHRAEALRTSCRRIDPFEEDLKAGGTDSVRFIGDWFDIISSSAVVPQPLTPEQPRSEAVRRRRQMIKHYGHYRPGARHHSGLLSGGVARRSSNRFSSTRRAEG